MLIMKISAGVSGPLWLATAACCLLLSSCSDSTQTTTKEPVKAPEPMSGQDALAEMYPAAHSWSGDVTIAELHSINLTEVKSADGKAGAWKATFYSPSKVLSKVYSWSAVDSGSLHQGTFAEPQEISGTKKGFEMGLIRTDSNAAYKTSVDKSADYIKKNPDKPMLIVLESNTRYPDHPTWRIIWGESLSVSDYSVYVDATTGKFLEKAH